MKNNRVFVDLSCTFIHHGHVRLLKKASRFGKVTVGLTTDKEIKKYKGYSPELKYASRKEILQSIKYVDKVIPCNFKLDSDYLKKNNFDLLIRGSDYKNQKFNIKTVIFSRTKGISSSKIRKKIKRTKY
jgi:glycerol-3-phosphate cytidylyltransferase